MELSNFEFSSEPNALHETDYKNRTLLLQAICNRNVKEVKELLKRTDVNFTNQKKETPLHTALRSQAGMQIVQELLHHGADASALNNDGNSPLHLCFDNDVTVELACVEALLKHGAKVNLAGYWNQTPLHRAIMRKAEMELIKALLHHGADVNAVDKNNNTPLHFCYNDDIYVECAKELLKYEVDVKVPNFYKQTPLHKALAWEEDMEVVNAILRYGADINAVDVEGNTPLYYAVEGESCTLSCVTELLKNGADVNATNGCKETALMPAVIWSNAEIVEELLAHGADPTMADFEGLTPLNEVMNGATIVQSSQKAKLLVKYTLFHNCVGDFSNLFNLNAYKQSENYYIVDCYLEKCVSELGKMKTMKVDDRFSLDVFFTPKFTNIPLYYNGKSTQEENLIASYPIYSDLLLPRVNYALERGMLLGKIKEVLNDDRNHFGLNYDCVYIIIKYLSNDNLCNLILALCNCDPHNFKPATGKR